MPPRETADVRALPREDDVNLEDPDEDGTYAALCAPKLRTTGTGAVRPYLGAEAKALTEGRSIRLPEWLREL